MLCSQLFLWLCLLLCKMGLGRWAWKDAKNPGPSCCFMTYGHNCSDSCMIDALGLCTDMSLIFYRQEAALECLSTGIKGRASAESPLALGSVAQGIAHFKSSYHFFSFLKIIYLFIYFFLAALGLHCCAWAFSSCGERGLLFIAAHRFLIVVASLVVEHGL